MSKNSSEDTFSYSFFELTEFTYSLEFNSSIPNLTNKKLKFLLKNNTSREAEDELS